MAMVEWLQTTDTEGIMMEKFSIGSQSVSTVFVAPRGIKPEHKSFIQSILRRLR